MPPHILTPWPIRRETTPPSSLHKLTKETRFCCNAQLVNHWLPLLQCNLRSPLSTVTGGSYSLPCTRKGALQRRHSAYLFNVKTLRYLRENGISLLEGLVLGYLHQNPDSCQNDFIRDFPMSRNQSSQLFTKCLLKGWIEVTAATRRSLRTDSFKFYTLTVAGEKHGAKIPADHE